MKRLSFGEQIQKYYKIANFASLNFAGYHATVFLRKLWVFFENIEFFFRVVGHWKIPFNLIWYKVTVFGRPKKIKLSFLKVSVYLGVKVNVARKLPKKG